MMVVMRTSSRIGIRLIGILASATAALVGSWWAQDALRGEPLRIADVRASVGAESGGCIVGGRCELLIRVYPSVDAGAEGTWRAAFVVEDAGVIRAEGTFLIRDGRQPKPTEAASIASSTGVTPDLAVRITSLERVG